MLAATNNSPIPAAKTNTEINLRPVFLAANTVVSEDFPGFVGVYGLSGSARVESRTCAESARVWAMNARDHPVRGVVLTLKTQLIANLGASLCSSGELRAELGVYPISLRSCKLFRRSSTPVTSLTTRRHPQWTQAAASSLHRCRRALSVLNQSIVRYLFLEVS